MTDRLFQIFLVLVVLAAAAALCFLGYVLGYLRGAGL